MQILVLILVLKPDIPVHAIHSLSLSLSLSLKRTHSFTHVIVQVIEKAGDKGIWTRDIKNQTNIQQQVFFCS